ncbi:MAG: hypothetical protein HXS48_26385 [Theionarchaea archaeon]|nr:hypothetical protein [Theionarchaea archaeon]
MSDEPSGSRPVKVRDIVIVTAIALFVVALDVVMIFLYDQMVTALVVVLAADFSICLIVGVAGIYFASRVGFPLWWSPSTDSPRSQQTSFITVLFGVTVVVGGMLLVFYRIIWSPMLQWYASFTLGTAIAFSLKNALYSEILFRLFIFSLIVWIGDRLSSRKYSLILGAIASAFLGSFQGLLFSAPLFLIGLLSVYIYYQRGLLPAVLVRFLAGAVPFIIIFTML